MPQNRPHAPEALRTPARGSRRTMTLRLALGAVFALTLFSVPGAVDPGPVAAGSSCTGWTSKARPPRSIKVLRTRTGRVETVGFRTYVAVVMASGEWPSRLHMATLEAGALATKQYAWYYTLAGNHRPGYARNGTCYDVRDDTQDQLYRPESSRPTARQHAAIDKTWSLTLRKYGRFFLTGYRYGAARSCGADANGWKLFEKSIDDCARQGWSSTRILTRYLSPDLKFVRSAATGPVIRPPRISLRAGNTIASGPALVRWRSVARGADVVKYQLQRKVGSGAWRNVPLADDSARSTLVSLKIGKTNHFRVRAKDRKGRSGPWSYSSRHGVSIRGPVGLRLGDGGVATASDSPHKVVVTLKSKSTGLVARTGPGMGTAKVYVNGRLEAIVDLEHAEPSPRELVWVRNWPKAGIRTLKVKAVLDGEPVQFNGFLTLR